LKDTEHSQGVIALVRAPFHNLEEICKPETPGLVVVLDCIQDPGNAGTIIRSAEAFGATGVVLLKGSVHPWNPKCLRASAGSLFRIPVVTGVEDLNKFAGWNWYVAAGEAIETIDVVDWTRPSLLFVGNEGAGVRGIWRDRSRALRIPTTGVESLNAAVAASVILYEAKRQRSL
jgi:TrmH family RNA methyltransferase